MRIGRWLEAFWLVDCACSSNRKLISQHMMKIYVPKLPSAARTFVPSLSLVLLVLNYVRVIVVLRVEASYGSAKRTLDQLYIKPGRLALGQGRHIASEGSHKVQAIPPLTTWYIPSLIKWLYLPEAETSRAKCGKTI